MCEARSSGYLSVLARILIFARPHHKSGSSLCYVCQWQLSELPSHYPTNMQYSHSVPLLYNLLAFVLSVVAGNGQIPYIRIEILGRFADSQRNKLRIHRIAANSVSVNIICFVFVELCVILRGFYCFSRPSPLWKHSYLQLAALQKKDCLKPSG
jgi:hypothetical protein